MSGSPQTRPALPFRLPPPPPGGLDLLVVAGEHSGDEHAAAAVRELIYRQPGMRVSAVGGPKLAAAGAQLLFDLTAHSVVGFVEVLRNYSFFKLLFEELVRWIAEHKPCVICLVDYPGFNLRLVSALRDRGLSVKGGGSIRIVYYISPQVWAWKAERRFSIATHVDAMGVIFPFEVATYGDTMLKPEFVGHPFADPRYRSPVRYDPDGPILLLPGSRRQAVARIFPALLAGHAAYGKRPAVVLYPSDDIRAVLESAHPPANVTLRRTGEPIGAAAVLTSSGTMSMHCALAAIPGAIAYRANPITYLIGRLLVKVRYIGIANLLLNEPMYPEYIQGASRPQALAAELKDSLENPARIERTREQAARLRDSLGHPPNGTAGAWLDRQLHQALRDNL